MLGRCRRALRALLPTLRSTALLALVCNLLLEITSLSGAGSQLWRYKTPAFVLLFLLGTAVVWLLVVLVHAVVGRFWLTATMAASATAVVALADFEKLRLLHEPLYPADWAFVGDLGFLTAMVGTRVLLLLVLAVLATVAVALGLRRTTRKRRLTGETAKHRPPRPPRMARLLVCGLCLLAIGYTGNFNSPGNAARRVYDLVGSDWRAPNQQANYLGNGFVGGFLYNLDGPVMAKPAGYSRAEMARIARKYARAAARINRTRDQHALDDLNVVLVLSESFSDPEALDGVRLVRDPIPYVRRLMSSTTSGHMLAQSIGGMTANMEFETLTGMSMSRFSPQMAVAFHQLVPDYHAFPSVVQWWRRTGRPAVAIHPFSPELYRRQEVYRTLGFDDSIFEDRMGEQHRIGNDAYISDASAVSEVERQIETHRKPLLLNLVTMQNHMPYAGRYDDPLAGPHGEPLGELGQYTRGLTYTDRAVKDLIDGLRRSDEKTVVVFYGDHLPGLYPDSVFARNSLRTMHETPFFVWANFPGQNAPQPTTSPIHFMDLALERADAPVPPYYALLQELRRQVPAMEGGTMVGAQDRELSPARLSPPATRLLRDYRLVQYDLSVGQRYSAHAMFASVHCQYAGKVGPSVTECGGMNPAETVTQVYGNHPLEPFADGSLE